MNRSSFPVALALALAPCAQTCRPRVSTLDAFWHTDPERATQAALDSKRPLLAVFR